MDGIALVHQELVPLWLILKTRQNYNLLASSTIIKGKGTAHRRLNKRSKIFKTIIQAIQEKKGEKIISIDLRKLPEAVADYFIVCEAGSGLQVRAIADHIEMRVKEVLSEKPFDKEGFATLQWVIIDYVNIVVHIFQPETRRFYSLEEMWNDAQQEEHDF